MTSAIPAEVMVGGVSINMVTKDAGNKWRGDTRYNYSNGCLRRRIRRLAASRATTCSRQRRRHVAPDFLGNPTQTTYDFNIAGGGALVQDRLWVNGSIRRWIVNKLVNAKNLDGTQAIDDNDAEELLGQGRVLGVARTRSFTFSYNWNNKIRGHRRDAHAQLQPDIASLVQTNPASSTQAKYTGIHNKLVFESSFSIMNGETDYDYQPGTPSTAFRIEDSALEHRRTGAAPRQEYQPNSRLEFDNVLSYTKSGLGRRSPDQGRRAVRAAALRRQVRRPERHVSSRQQRQGDVRASRVQHADRTRTTSTRGRVLRAGRVDDGQSPDVEPRRCASITTSARCRRSRRRRHLHRGAVDPESTADQAEPRRVAHRPRRTIRSATARRRSRRATAATVCRSASIA